MTVIKKYKLLKMPNNGTVDWSKKEEFKTWEPDPLTRSEIATKIGNINKKKIGR